MRPGTAAGANAEAEAHTVAKTRTGLNIVALLMLLLGKGTLNSGIGVRRDAHENSALNAIVSRMPMQPSAKLFGRIADSRVDFLVSLVGRDDGSGYNLHVTLLVLALLLLLLVVVQRLQASDMIVVYRDFARFVIFPTQLRTSMARGVRDQRRRHPRLSAAVYCRNRQYPGGTRCRSTVSTRVPGYSAVRFWCAL
eukprot:1668956-Rhodomonas_salina.1